MATVTVTETPTTLDATGAAELAVTNIGSASVYVNTQRLRPGQRNVFDTSRPLQVTTQPGQTSAVDTAVTVAGGGTTGGGSGLPAGGTTGQVITKTATGAGWASIGRPLKSGWYYPALSGGSARGMGGVGQCWIYPLDVEVATTFSAAACNVTVAGAAGAVVRGGIFASAADGMPGDLLLDMGTVDITATGAKTWTFATPLTVQPDRIWLAAAWQGTTTTVPSLTGYDGKLPMLGWSAFQAAGIIGYQWAAGTVPGAFPVNLGAPTGVETSTCPRVQLRVA